MSWTRVFRGNADGIKQTMDREADDIPAAGKAAINAAVDTLGKDKQWNVATSGADTHDGVNMSITIYSAPEMQQQQQPTTTRTATK